jgi:CDP-diacylglycerol--serine O-phosphatidyltransferase
LPDLNQPVSDAHIQRKRPPRAAYALPTLFTAGNIFLGFLSIIRTIQGALNVGANPAQAAEDFEFAAKAIGFSFLLDGLDGRIARMTHTTSEFGKELDSLADIIAFGIAPAILAYTWGVHFATGTLGAWSLEQFQSAGKFLSFFFLVCGAGRLARFNITRNPVPRNPGKPHRKYFVGLPIPAAAAMVASVVYAASAGPITDIVVSALWLGLLALLGLLMISAWRYWSFKELNLLRPRSPVIVVVLGVSIYVIWLWSRPVLLLCSSLYVASGIAARAGGIVRRLLKRGADSKQLGKPETQVG